MSTDEPVTIQLMTLLDQLTEEEVCDSGAISDLDSGLTNTATELSSDGSSTQLLTETEEDSTALPCNDKPLVTSVTSLSCNDKPLVTSGTALPCDDRPLVTSGTALPCDDTPMVTSGTALPCDDTPMVTSGTALPCNDKLNETTGGTPEDQTGCVVSCFRTKSPPPPTLTEKENNFDCLKEKQVIHQYLSDCRSNGQEKAFLEEPKIINIGSSQDDLEYYDSQLITNVCVTVTNSEVIQSEHSIPTNTEHDFPADQCDRGDFPADQLERDQGDFSANQRERDQGDFPADQCERNQGDFPRDQGGWSKIKRKVKPRRSVNTNKQELVNSQPPYKGRKRYTSPADHYRRTNHTYNTDGGYESYYSQKPHPHRERGKRGGRNYNSNPVIKRRGGGNRHSSSQQQPSRSQRTTPTQQTTPPNIYHTRTDSGADSRETVADRWRDFPFPPVTYNHSEVASFLWRG